jgi:hypothetical protein
VKIDRPQPRLDRSVYLDAERSMAMLQPEQWFAVTQGVSMFVAA